MERYRILLLSTLATFALGCQRTPDNESARIIIQVPEALNKTENTGAPNTTMPTDRKICYGVNVTGPGIALQTPNTCSLASGLLAGFVEPGKTVEITVPRGENRSIELYAFLQSPGQNAPCPQFAPSLSSNMVSRIYRVGSTSGVNLLKDTETVDITASFPGLANHIGQELGMPATCIATINPPQPTGFQVSSGAGIATGGGKKLFGRIGTPAAANVATGGGKKLIQR